MVNVYIVAAIVVTVGLWMAMTHNDWCFEFAVIGGALLGFASYYIAKDIPHSNQVMSFIYYYIMPITMGIVPLVVCIISYIKSKPSPSAASSKEERRSD